MAGRDSSPSQCGRPVSGFRLWPADKSAPTATRSAATWVGFDALLTVACLTTVVVGRHHHPTVVMARLFTAVLLVCDAWFDVALEFGTQDVWWSITSAVGIELPLAAYLLRRSYRVISMAPWTALARDGQE